MSLWIIFGLFVLVSMLATVLFLQNNNLRERILQLQMNHQKDLLSSLSLAEAKTQHLLRQKDEQIQTLLDRVMAGSLSEYRATPLTDNTVYDPEGDYQRSMEEGEVVVDFSADLQELGLVTGGGR